MCIYALLPITDVGPDEYVTDARGLQMGMALADLVVPEDDSGMGTAVGFALFTVDSAGGTPYCEKVIGPGAAPSRLPIGALLEMLDNVDRKALAKQMADYARKRIESFIENDAIRVQKRAA